MPGLLRADARCPRCDEQLLCIVDTTGRGYITREYFHTKGSPKARRKRRCKFTFFGPDVELGKRERRELES